MKALVKFIAFHTAMWIAAETLYTRVCHEGFEPFLDSCFYFSSSAATYSESTKACRSFNPSAWLYVPHDESELQAFGNKVPEVYGHLVPHFIRLGIKQPPGLATNEGWYWGSGKAIAATSWCVYEPNDNKGFDERDIMINANHGSCFHDVGEASKRHYVCAREMSVYCPENYRLYNGRCLGAHRNRMKFSDAEAECNKLPGGHLAAFRSQKELEFINSLLGGYKWVGLTDEGDEGNWTFTDGTTLPTGIMFNLLNGGRNENCGFVDSEGLDDQTCAKTLRYVCMAKAHAGILPNVDDPENLLGALFDFIPETCLNVLNTLFKMNRNRLDLIIPQVIEDGLVRVYFSQKVDCRAKKIIYEFKESTECDREYVKSCDQVTSGNARSTSCEYRCPCEQDGCRIVMIDEFGNQSADVCEISYE